MKFSLIIFHSFEKYQIIKNKNIINEDFLYGIKDNLLLLFSSHEIINANENNNAIALP